MTDTSSIISASTSTSTTSPSTLSSDSTTTLVPSNRENPVKGFLKGILKQETSKKVSDQAYRNEEEQIVQSDTQKLSKTATGDLSSNVKFTKAASKSGWSSATATQPSLGG
ncbi:hypothetical protein CVT26_000906 [Gymnopilus dilepis]|uniref:Uncharacterized protein n=1 Tax=Gymnopilus dilepis TaxID=231916 RepID=A0A409VI48_9AGAR|nr:hypothetical protein CVT26_000906 [Gymnopilus dilepis]